jgi:hypothetical protein
MSRTRALSVVLAALGLTAAAGASSEALEELKIVYLGDVAAHFAGEEVPLAPREYGIRELWFTFEGDPERHGFRPAGQLHFSDWSFEIFSSNGTYVLLLQDHYGPYHVVRVDRLKDYLHGRAEPEAVVGGPRPGEPAAVYRDAEWTSDDAFRYTVACCGEEWRRIHRVAQPIPSDGSSYGALRYRPELALEWDALPPAWLDRLGELLAAFEKLEARIRDAPGRWVKGDAALGAEPREYEPSNAQLLAAEVGERIGRIVAAERPDAVLGALRAAGSSKTEIEYEGFTFRHADVTGNGRFYYASPPRRARVALPR